jgi:hypothetical protein
MPFFSKSSKEVMGWVQGCGFPEKGKKVQEMQTYGLVTY